MRIGFNGQRLAGQRFGVGRYIEYLLRHWAEQLTPDEQVELFLRRPLEPDLATLSPKLRPALLNSRLDGIPWENLRLRGPAARTDVLFCPAYTAPVGFRGRLVVATHSVNETQPEAHSRLYANTYGRLYRICAQQADAVIVPGEATRQAVIDHYKVPSERIHIVNQGADDAFRPIDDPEILAQARRKFFGVDRPYILFVGKCSPRRNIPMLVRAFAKLRAERNIPHGLVLFGPAPDALGLPALVEELGLAGHVIQTEGKVDHHSELVPIYGAADVFVHPSENEGWSMTTVEAMACGTAVVAADRGGLGEVTRGHALMIDDPSVDSLVEAIGRVLSDDTLKRELERLAFQRGEALRWREICLQTLSIVRDVGRGPGG